MRNSQEVSRTSELSARCAVLVARLYEMQRWRWGGFGNRPAYVPDAEGLAEAIEQLIEHSQESESYGFISTGRLAVRRDDEGDLEVYLHLGGIDKYGHIECDDQMGALREQ